MTYTSKFLELAFAPVLTFNRIGDLVRKAYGPADANEQNRAIVELINLTADWGVITRMILDDKKILMFSISINGNGIKNAPSIEVSTPLLSELSSCYGITKKMRKAAVNMRAEWGPWIILFLFKDTGACRLMPI